MKVAQLDNAEEAWWYVVPVMVVVLAAAAVAASVTARWRASWPGGRKRIWDMGRGPREQNTLQDSELQRVVVRSALEGVLAQEQVKVRVLVRGNIRGP